MRSRPRLAGLLAQERPLRDDPVARAYFYDEAGAPRPVGFVLRNPAFAQTLRAIAEKGADAFYSGPIAEDIVATVTRHPSNPGDMTLADLAGYKVEERARFATATASTASAAWVRPARGIWRSSSR